MSLAPGTRLGPYEIVAPLGAGGMGEVYRAKDTRLGREVAIKGLPEGLASHPERLSRFEREARLLASLSHPNVAGIHGLEDSGGTPWLVLELVEGESLAQRLARGALPVRETLEVGAQVAAGMEAAHERGIVHRDLKPANVMLTTARVAKVLDFGLARGGASEAASSPDLSASPTMALPTTAAGIILGTASYMSPEQARGLAVDRRADVWAFGCLLYECLTARQAFAGETVSDVIARILEREPEWNALPVSVPPRLREVVRRCLVKEAADRPRDIGDLGRELASILAGLSSGSGAHAAPGTAPSLAVLYFENLAGGAENDYFCAGITEDILTDLSKIKGLRVASRNAVARYRGTPLDPARVAAELGVGAVLEGSVRRAGERVRISAQLVNAADGFHLWAERYDRTMDDVFAVQEEIASSIAAALRVTLSPAESASLGRDRPQDVRAYDLYLKGRQLYGRYDDASLREALEVFRQATVIDPGYALAWAGIADCYGQLCQWGRAADVAELTRMGLEAARHALQLDPRLPEAYKAESLNLGFTGDRDGARAALLRALEVDPRFLPAINNLTVDGVRRSDIAGAERYARRAAEIDPQDAFAFLWLAFLARLTRREDEALALCDRVRRLTSESFYVSAVHTVRATIHMQRGDLDAAERTVAAGRADGARAIEMRVVEAAIAARRGRHAEARALVAEFLDQPGISMGGIQSLAETALRLGDAAAAVALIGRPVAREMAPTLARLQPDLHALLDLAPLAPRRSEATLVWPLEAPMLEASVHRAFREVRIESGLPDASGVRSSPA